jgi:hypothetical protein
MIDSYTERFTGKRSVCKLKTFRVEKERFKLSKKIATRYWHASYSRSGWTRHISDPFHNPRGHPRAGICQDGRGLLRHRARVAQRLYTAHSFAFIAP